MSRRVACFAIALLSVTVSVSAQTLPGAPARPSLPPTGYPSPPRSGGVVIGQVIDAATGRAVPRAIVKLTGKGVAQAIATDDNGRFYFVDVPESDVQLVATKSGFFDGAYGKRRASGDGIPLTVSNGR